MSVFKRTSRDALFVYSLNFGSKKFFDKNDTLLFDIFTCWFFALAFFLASFSAAASIWECNAAMFGIQFPYVLWDDVIIGVQVESCSPKRRFVDYNSDCFGVHSPFFSWLFFVLNTIVEYSALRRNVTTFHDYPVFLFANASLPSTRQLVCFLSCFFSISSVFTGLFFFLDKSS